MCNNYVCQRFIFRTHISSFIFFFPFLFILLFIISVFLMGGRNESSNLSKLVVVMISIREDLKKIYS